MLKMSFIINLYFSERLTTKNGHKSLLLHDEFLQQISSIIDLEPSGNYM